jgi:hypothetical protein
MAKCVLTMYTRAYNIYLGLSSGEHLDIRNLRGTGKSKRVYYINIHYYLLFSTFLKKYFASVSVMELKKGESR